MQTIFLILSLVGAGIFCLGVVKFNKSYQIKKDGIRVKATLIHYNKGIDKEGMKMYRPVYLFRSVKGEDVEVVSNISSSVRSHKVGDKVELVYERDYPEKAKRINFFSIYIESLVCFILATPALLIGVGYFLFKWEYI